MATVADQTADPTPTTRPPRRLRVVVGAIVMLLVWLGVAAIGGQDIGQLSQLQKNDSASFLPADAESTQVADVVAQFRDDTTLPLIVVAEADTVGPEQFAAAQTFAATLPQRTIDLDGEHPISDYLADDQVVAIPSQDGQAILVVLSLDSDKVSTPVEDTRPLAPIADAVRQAIDDELTPAGFTAYVTGPAGFVDDLTAAFAGIDGILLAVALVVVLVILLVVYRSPILPIAVLLTAVFGLAAAGLVIYRVADAGLITVSGQSQGILSILVVGAATDYALLLVSRYKEELHQRDSTLVALGKAWRASVEPIMASALTVILGLLALMLADLKGTAGLGPVGALGILGALLAALTFLPAVLVLGRRWIFWPAVPRLDHATRADQLAARRGWGRVAALVGRRPLAVGLTTLIALLIAGAFLPTFKADGVSQSEFFLTEVDSVTGQDVLAEHFDAGSGSPLQVIAPQDQAIDVLTVLQQEPGITDPFIGLTPAAPSEPVDGRVLVQATFTDPADSQAAVDTVSRLRTDLHEVDPGVLVGGETAQALDTKIAADRDLRVVVPTIIAVVFLVLCVLLRSLVAPTLLILVNLLSFAATMGVSALVFNHVLDFPGADPTTVLYGFVFLVALGVDYSIFLMTRTREEAKRRGTRQGVLVALTVTGGVITSAGVVLAATFGALAVIPLLFLAQVAFIVAFGVLVDTLVVRSLLVPSAVIGLGRFTWWPDRRLSRSRGPSASGA
ncbi:MAG: MMPL family transporter [Actinomycetales bacterium]